jgi:hypothetical protein
MVSGATSEGLPSSLDRWMVVVVVCYSATVDITIA